MSGKEDQQIEVESEDSAGGANREAHHLSVHGGLAQAARDDQQVIERGPERVEERGCCLLSCVHVARTCRLPAGRGRDEKRRWGILPPPLRTDGSVSRHSLAHLSLPSLPHSQQDARANGHASAATAGEAMVVDAPGPGPIPGIAPLPPPSSAARMVSGVRRMVGSGSKDGRRAWYVCLLLLPSPPRLPTTCTAQFNMVFGTGEEGGREGGREGGK